MWCLQLGTLECRSQADHMDYTLVIVMSVKICLYSSSVYQKSLEQSSDGLVLW